MEPQIREIVKAQAHVFTDLGCIVEEAEPDISGADEIFKTLRAWSFEAGMREHYEDDRDALKATILWNIEQGKELTGAQLSRAEELRTELFQRVRRFMGRHEFLILPVTQVLPFDVNCEYPTEINGEPMETYIDWMKSCYWISATGLPALSVPCGFSSEGLPVGLQIVGRYRDDWGVLQMGNAFEEATGYWKRKPK
jgi:amidase